MDLWALYELGIYYHYIFYCSTNLHLESHSSGVVTLKTSKEF